MLFFTAIRGIFYLELGLRRHLIADLTEELGVPIVKTRKYLTNEASFSVRTYARTRERRNRRGGGAELIKLVENKDGNNIGVSAITQAYS